MLPLLESVASVIQPPQNWVTHYRRVDERASAGLDTVIAASAVQPLSAVRTEGLRARGGGEERAPEGWVGCREGVGDRKNFLEVFKWPMVVIYCERVDIRLSGC